MPYTATNNIKNQIKKQNSIAKVCNKITGINDLVGHILIAFSTGDRHILSAIKKLFPAPYMFTISFLWEGGTPLVLM